MSSTQQSVEFYKGYIITAYAQHHKDYPSFVATIRKEHTTPEGTHKVYLTNVEAGTIDEAISKAKIKVNSFPDNKD
jgi:hypothetical protein